MHAGDMPAQDGRSRDVQPALRIPLAARVPNFGAAPPGVPSWDEAGLTDARATLVTCPVLWVSGSAGDAARWTQALVHAAGTERLERTLWFVPDLRGGDVIGGLLGLLVRAGGLAAPEWSVVFREPELLVELGLDTADALDVWIVVHADDEAERWGRFALAAAQYGRVARWLFAATKAPPAGLDPRCDLRVRSAADAIARVPASITAGVTADPTAAVPANRTAGVTAHAAAASVPATLTAGVTAHATAASTPQATEADEALGELDQLIARGAAVAIAEWLDAYATALLQSGWAPAIHERLAAGRAPELATWRLRSALETGDLARLARMAPLDPALDGNVWLEARRSLALGRTAESLELALRAAAASSDPDIVRDALLLAARLAAIVHDPARAAQLLVRLGAQLAEASTGQRAAAAILLALGGQTDEANALAWGVEEELILAGKAPDARTLEALLEAWIFLDEISAGVRVFERWAVGQPRVLSPMLFYSGAFLYLQAARLREADVYIERLVRFVTPQNIWGRAVGYLRARATLGRGGFAVLPAAIEALWQRSVSARDVLHAVLAQNLDTRLAIFTGTSRRLGAWPADLPAPTSRHRPSVARRPADADDRGAHDRARLDRTAVLMRVFEAEAATARGDEGTAFCALDELCGWLDARGLYLDRADMAVPEALVAFVFGAPDRLRRALDVLAAAARWPSPRFELEHRAILALTAKAPDYGAFEAMLAASDDSPLAAHLARLVLGVGPSARTLDIPVLATLTSRWGPPPLTARGAADQPGWGLDLARNEIWRCDGPRISVAKAPMVRELLQVLLEQPAGCTKAELALRAWGIAAYHPLRDDKRMQVAIRKLRGLVETNARSPRRVVTTAEGYAIGAAEPARVAAAIDPERTPGYKPHEAPGAS